MSGLRLNSKKTEALWIGSMVGNKEKLFPEKNFKWPEKKVKALGVWLSTDPSITLNINYREKTDKIRNILSNWKYRRLTLLGKIQVIKSLAASQLTYILAPLATNHKIIKEVNDLFYSFLWDNKGDKIKRSVMINDYKNGGLKMVDIASFTKSLKTVWIKKYLDDSNRGKWKEFFELELGKYGGKLIFRCNLHKRDISKSMSVQDPFLQEILEIWSEANFDDKIKTEQQFLEQHIWHNSLIRIENRPVFYKDLFLHGITKVGQLMTDSRSFLPLADLISTYNIRIQPIKSEVGQVFALSWLITWYGHVLKDFASIVRLYDFFLATHPLMPVYFGAALVIRRRTDVLTGECEMSYVHHLLSRIPDDLPDYVEELITTAHSLFCKYPPEKLAGAVERYLKESMAVTKHKQFLRELEDQRPDSVLRQRKKQLARYKDSELEAPPDFQSPNQTNAYMKFAVWTLTASVGTVALYVLSSAKRWI
ncbi:hypothetical protein ACROYT_G013489 [Oculina patagonica]